MRFPSSHHLLMQHTSQAYRDSRFMPEQAWERHLQAGENWQPAHGPLLVVGPRPNDVILGAGGLIHTWVSWGHDVTVLSVTDGESDGGGAEPVDLMRRDELRAALRKLCATHVSVVRMGLRDGFVNQARNRLRMAIDALVEPRMTLIAPIEQGGHDQDAVGMVCRESARANGVPLARYLLRTRGSDPSSSLGGAWGRFALDMEARRAKAHAVQCFNSQRDANAARIDPFQRSFEAFLI
jgi:LmbE family N-acetylglucosaminyl deacetylase